MAESENTLLSLSTKNRIKLKNITDTKYFTLTILIILQNFDHIRTIPKLSAIVVKTCRNNIFHGRDLVRPKLELFPHMVHAPSARHPSPYISSQNYNSCYTVIIFEFSTNFPLFTLHFYANTIHLKLSLQSRHMVK